LPFQIAKARENGLKRVFVGDVQDLAYPPELQSLEGSYDAVFTNAALHWCKRDPAGVVRSAKSALRKGGRFVGEMGGLLNVIGVRSAIHHVLKARGIDAKKLDPWFFPSVAEYQHILESGGFQVNHISLSPRITPLPGPLTDWMRTFTRSGILGDMTDEEAEEVMKEAQDICEVDMRDEAGNWHLMYVRLRFVAVLPSDV